MTTTDTHALDEGPMGEATAMDLLRAERERQVDVEGWTPEHDDQHDDGEIMAAAMCYYLHAVGTASYRYVVMGQQRNQRVRTHRAYEAVTVPVPMGWPWDIQWWKPRDTIRNLVRSGALMLAEKDRLARAGLYSDHIDHKLALVEQALSQEITNDD